MKLYKSLKTDERGVVMVFVALGMVVILGFCALVVDVGMLYFEKSKLQKAADAAALGGAQELPFSESEAKAKAVSIANENINGATIPTPEVGEGGTPTWIRVQLERDVPPTFARILGFNNDITVKANAKVELNALSSGEGVLPIGVDLEKYPNFGVGNDVVLRWSDSEEGNFGYLAFYGPGADVLKDLLEDIHSYDNYKEIFVGRAYPTQTGNIASIHDLLKKLEGETVLVPIYETVASDYTLKENDECVNTNTQGGKSCVLIKGFATVKIASVENEKKENGNAIGKIEVTATIEKANVAGNSSPEAINYSTYGLKLVE
ncbi:pilus assembly protein TadG-related protein [Anaerobacillus sp. MEB173]|uniref:pilus assembly protein TadG-related protein n=1 Tax=Anaerobacillus sp. MEB173 TaxID=3383345 RepID=UPI003F8DC492